MLCRLPVHQLWYALSSATLLKSDKSRVIFDAPCLTLCFLRLYKTATCLKLKPHPCKVNIAIVVDTVDVSHLKDSQRLSRPYPATGSHLFHESSNVITYKPCQLPFSSQRD